ncbi:hypothetical protein CCUS01_01687 [Colletotrichum cuscutae]|uniref:Uncharacterized protein n=1 Tax=Colletotrichum cuscutae TaxID=1209917 RepID=A0AAI9UH45_9PEZI|nr:hypothetical protein CCUS01_01687 [Colletotrichum cuscutae]
MAEKLSTYKTPSSAPNLPATRHVLRPSPRAYLPKLCAFHELVLWALTPESSQEWAGVKLSAGCLGDATQPQCADSKFDGCPRSQSLGSDSGLVVYSSRSDVDSGKLLPTHAEETYQAPSAGTPTFRVPSDD